MLAGSDDGSVHAWDLVSGAAVAMPQTKRHAGVVTALDFSTKTDAYMSGGFDGNAFFWYDA